MRQIFVGNPDLINVKVLLWEAGLTKREAPTLIFLVRSVLSSNSLFKYHKPLINIYS